MVMKFDDRWFRRQREKLDEKLRKSHRTTGRYRIATPLDRDTIDNIDRLFGETYRKDLEDTFDLIRLNLHSVIPNIEIYSLLDSLNTQLYFEWLLQLEPKRYRDHIIHAVKVAFIGERLLYADRGLLGIDLDKTISKLLADNKGIQEFVKSSNIDAPIDFDKVVEKVWWMASIFHDLGYPFCCIKRMYGKIEENYPYIVERYGFHDDIWGIIHAIRKSLLYQVYQAVGEEQKIREAFEKNRHGFWGAINLLFHYEDLMRRRVEIEPNTFLAIHLAALAIFKHDFASEICFDEDSISFLLLLSDELQEWGRIYVLIRRDKKVRSKRIIENIRESREVRVVRGDSRLIIAFYYLKRETERTDWKLEEVCEDKEKKFKILQPGKIFPEIRYGIDVEWVC